MKKPGFSEFAKRLQALQPKAPAAVAPPVSPRNVFAERRKDHDCCWHSTSDRDGTRPVRRCCDSHCLRTAPRWLDYYDYKIETICAPSAPTWVLLVKEWPDPELSAWEDRPATILRVPLVCLAAVSASRKTARALGADYVRDPDGDRPPSIEPVFVWPAPYESTPDCLSNWHDHYDTASYLGTAERAFFDPRPWLAKAQTRFAEMCRKVRWEAHDEDVKAKWEVLAAARDAEKKLATGEDT